MIDASTRQSSRGGEFHPPPVFWERLPNEDRAEFLRLRNQLHSYQKPTGKDPRVVTFRKELLAVLKFIERDEAHREERSILTGIAFAGPFICVNTRLLKSFLGRCKSSINGGFQQMGYVAIRTKAKARSCIVTVMRSLTSDPALLRQWTVRGASPHADSCFVSSFNVALLPDVTQADLNFMQRSNSFMVEKPTNHQLTTLLSSQVSNFLQSSQLASLAQKKTATPASSNSFNSEDTFVRFDEDDWGFGPTNKEDIGINDIGINRDDLLLSSEVLDEPKWDSPDFSMTRSFSTIDFDGDWIVRSPKDWAL